MFIKNQHTKCGMHLWCLILYLNHSITSKLLFIHSCQVWTSIIDQLIDEFFQSLKNYLLSKWYVRKINMSIYKKEMAYTKAEYTVVMLSASWVVGIKCKNHLQFRGSSFTPGCQRREYLKVGPCGMHMSLIGRNGTGKEKSPGKVKEQGWHYGGRERKGWETVNISGASDSQKAEFSSRVPHMWQTQADLIITDRSTSSIVSFHRCGHQGSV